MGKLVSGVTDFLGLTDVRGTERRANEAAAATTAAAERGAQASAFRPVGMTTRFGRSMFDITDVGGIPRVTSAGYEVSPELLAIQDALMGLTGGGINLAREAEAAGQPLGAAARNLFELGASYLGESPQAVQNRVFSQLEAMREPGRMREEQRLGAGVFGRGRAGLNIAGMGQPELFALSQAREEQRAQDALAAEQAARQQIEFGRGLFGAGAGLLGEQYGLTSEALGPLQTLLGTIGTIEEMGQEPFRLGLAVGGAAQPGATAAANLLTSGLTSAAGTRMAGGQAASNQLTNFMGGLFGSFIPGLTSRLGGGGGGGGFGTGSRYGNQDYGMFF